MQEQEAMADCFRIGANQPGRRPGGGRRGGRAAGGEQGRASANATGRGGPAGGAGGQQRGQVQPQHPEGRLTQHQLKPLVHAAAQVGAACAVCWNWCEVPDEDVYCDGRLCVIWIAGVVCGLCASSCSMPML